MAFAVSSRNGVELDREFGDDECPDAAQEAEFLHAETGVPHLVVERGTGEVFYESRGPTP